jgi:hypothetical protein
MYSFYLHIKSNYHGFILFSFFLPSVLLAETKSWTGYGGDSNWSNPLNWSGTALPQPTDDVLLDNTDLPVSYQVVLPDVAVTLRTIQIIPSPGRNIELILPVSNKITNAFSVTGPGYGIELNAGAIFRNASGLSSGESLVIADSMIIHDGGRYIHQTRASHANNILKFLSTAPGTEQGIFDFDVPKASYTISVSNRTYGSLELHASAFGAMVNYTCTGANPLLLHGNLRIGANVSMSVDLSGPNGNIQVEGDFIQEGGQLKLASGMGDNTILRIKGDLYQTPGTTITETNSGIPFIELDGFRRQEIAMAGSILNQVGFRVNNQSGCALKLPLEIPYALEMKQGTMNTSASALLILDSGATISIDSSRLTGTYIDGPMRKLGLKMEDHFLFPVGKDGNLRWLELKHSVGNYTVEYIHQNPVSIGSSMGPGLDHISKLEYWTVFTDGAVNNQSKIELSFASTQSGVITDPNYLNVAKFQSSQWKDAGHTAITGNIIQGSVLSEEVDFSANNYTLASVLDLENPLPLTSLDLYVSEISGKPFFSWTVVTDEKPDHFNLSEETDGLSTLIAQINAVDQQIKYNWAEDSEMKSGIHFFRIGMIDMQGNEYLGKLVPYKKEIANNCLNWISQGSDSKQNQLLIQSETSDEWNYEIISLRGGIIKKGILNIGKGLTFFPTGSMDMIKGEYVFRALDSKGRCHVLLFGKN